MLNYIKQVFQNIKSTEKPVISGVSPQVVKSLLYKDWLAVGLDITNVLKKIESSHGKKQGKQARARR